MGKVRPTVFFLAATLVASPLLAATVVLVQPANPPSGMTEALVRIHGELMSAGFDMKVVNASATAAGSGESRGWLERLATQRDADAVVAMLGNESPDSVEVWVIDKVTGKSVVRRVAFQAGSARGPETLAIQAIELLRASFMEIDLFARSGPGEAQSALSPTVIRFVEKDRKSRSERFGLEVGATVITSINGVGPSVMPIARFDWALRPWLIAQVTAAGLGTRPGISTKSGSAGVAQEFVLLGASYRFRLGKRFQPFASLSGGFLHISADGKAESPNQGVGAERWSFLLDGGFGVGMMLENRLHLSLAAHAQVAEPYPAVRFLGTVVATSGRPNVLFTLTIGAWL